eukprot:15365670-Ditylum_brightwellii.AAC.1
MTEHLVPLDALEGGITASTDAMHIHQYAIGVQISGCAALANIAMGSIDDRVNMAECGGMYAIVKTPYTPHKTLGHCKAPGGGGFTQKQILKEIATRYAVRVMTSALIHTEAQREAICSFTSKMGYNRNMVHVIREGPYQYGGA